MAVSVGVDLGSRSTTTSKLALFYPECLCMIMITKCLDVLADGKASWFHVSQLKTDHFYAQLQIISDSLAKEGLVEFEHRRAISQTQRSSSWSLQSRAELWLFVSRLHWVKVLAKVRSENYLTTSPTQPRLQWMEAILVSRRRCHARN